MEPSKEEFVNQMLLSEVVITAITFIGVYLIFRNFWKKQEKEKAEKEKKDQSDKKEV
ncbi:MAG: hypothetical protein H6605_05020 [Flavobacteriales bacterium]|nr:hypothetical protein [Flavobacteriales bacterium]